MFSANTTFELTKRDQSTFARFFGIPKPPQASLRFRSLSQYCLQVFKQISLAAYPWAFGRWKYTSWSVLHVIIKHTLWRRFEEKLFPWRGFLGLFHHFQPRLLQFSSKFHSQRLARYSSNKTYSFTTLVVQIVERTIQAALTTNFHFLAPAALPTNVRVLSDHQNMYFRTLVQILPHQPNVAGLQSEFHQIRL